MAKKNKLFIGCYNKSVIVTYIGIIIATIGIILQLNSSSELSVKNGLICLIFSGLCDLFDGPIAREMKRTELEKSFGIQIDSLADVIISIVLPITILNNISYNYYSGYTKIISIIYILCGLIRLAYFNIMTDGHTKYYYGLPVTYIALILPIEISIFWHIESETQAIVCMLTMLITAIAFIINVRISKPRGIFYGIFPTIAALVILYIVRM